MESWFWPENNSKDEKEQESDDDKEKDEDDIAGPELSVRITVFKIYKAVVEILLASILEISEMAMTQ